MTILAIDFGTRRLGLAIATDEGRMAYPIGTIDRVSMARDLENLAAQVKSREVSELVVGLPLNMDGSEGVVARSARNFGTKLAGLLELPVHFVDERLTSFEARARLRELGTVRARKPAVDAVAATIILEQWLSEQRSRS